MNLRWHKKSPWVPPGLLCSSLHPCLLHCTRYKLGLQQLVDLIDYINNINLLNDKITVLDFVGFDGKKIILWHLWRIKPSSSFETRAVTHSSCIMNTHRLSSRWFQSPDRSAGMANAYRMSSSQAEQKLWLKNKHCFVPRGATPWWSWFWQRQVSRALFQPIEKQNVW